MYGPREKVFWFSVTSRCAVILLQFVFNASWPDHEADAFRSPRDPSERVTVFDGAVDVALGGLARWDAQYFLHIAKYGYTYEETLAFFPLYPMAVRCVASLLKIVLFVTNDHSLTIVAAVTINFACFVKSSMTLYDLSEHVFGSNRVAYKAAILYCINPASIFFTAGYSESMFAYLTFYSMLHSLRDDRFVYFPVGLSTIVRSNGLLNIGFPVYELFERNIFFSGPKIARWWNGRSVTRTFAPYLIDTLLTTVRIINCIFLSAVPYVFHQFYNYAIFCTDYSRDESVPAHVVRYAREKNITIAGDIGVGWCDANPPIAYSTIQEKYWNVGLFRYYEYKQIPNFLLASPVLLIMLKCSYEYFKDNATIILSLFCVERRERHARANRLPVGMFVFVVHGMFLTLFSVLFVHIQVSTRLLASASPIIYWYCANELSSTNYKSSNDYENYANRLSKWKVFFMNQKNYTIVDKFILFYFLGYLVAGCFMHSNFLPWT